MYPISFCYYYDIEYPAVFDYSEKGVINLSFPDFPGASSFAENDPEAISSAQDVLALYIREYEETKQKMPKPSYVIKASAKQRIVFVQVWMPYYRSKIKEQYVKKTLTIPSWLNILAMQNNVNFSSVLVEGLKRELDLTDL